MFYLRSLLVNLKAHAYKKLHIHSYESKAENLHYQ